MDIKNSIRRNFAEDEIWNGSVSPTNKKPTIKVNFNVPNDSELRIYQSPSGHSWTYNNYTVSGFGSREVGVNGSHYYVWFKSGDDAISVISTYLVETINDEFSVSVLGMNFDEDGKLLVSSSGSGGGDASSDNQVLQLNAAINSNLAIFNQLSTQTDRVLFDTDLIYNQLISSNTVLSSIDVSCNNMEVLLDNYRFTNGNLHVRDDRTLTELQGSNIAQYTKLGLIAEVAEDTLLSVDGINAKLNALQLQSAKYTIEAVSSLAPDTTPAFTPPPTGIEKSEGWYFKNTSTGQPSQVYYYSYTNPSLQIAGRQFAYQLNDIICGYCVVRLLSVNSTEGLPTLGIYTRPTGSGDAAPGFYKSRKVYNIPSTAKLTQGMRIMLWWGTVQPSLKLHPNVARIELQLATTTGTAAGTELLAYLTVNTDSAALAGNAEYILSAAGFQYAAELIMDTQFTGESSAGTTAGDATAANQLASNTAICARLETISSNLGQLNFSDSNLLVYDGASNFTLGLVKDELITLNGVYSDLLSGTAQLSVAIDPANDGVSLYAYNTTSMMPEALTLNTDSGMKALDVHVINQPTGYASESTLADISELITAQSLYDRFQCEIPLSDSKLDTIITNMSLTNFNVTNLSKCDTDNVAIPGGVDINNLPTIQQVSLAGETLSVSVSGTVPISSGSALDVNCYGSSDGVQFHHLKTNTQGVLKTNAIMETDENGALTSELKTGTGAYNALHVWVKNPVELDPNSTVYIQNLPATPIEISGHLQNQDAQNSILAVDETVYGPVVIGGGGDTQGYLWISVAIQFSEVITGGSIYLEYSGDGAIWFRGNTSSEQTYIMPSASQVHVLLRPATPCTFRYVRVFTDTVSANNAYAWVSMK